MARGRLLGVTTLTHMGRDRIGSAPDVPCMTRPPATLGLLLFVSLIPACEAQTGSSQAESEPPARGAIGKADLPGSCLDGEENSCGGPSQGECWCDDECEGYGDCCADYRSVCVDDGDDGDDDDGGETPTLSPDALDVNADGYADLAVGAPGAEGVETGGWTNGSAPPEVGKMFVFLGGPDGLDPEPHDELQVPGEGHNYFSSVLRSYTISDGSGRDGIFSASTRLWRFDASPRRLWPYERVSAAGYYHVAVLGDVDGDGIEELATGGQGRLHIYSSGGGSVLIYGEPFEPSVPNPDWGLYSWGVGDVNGDGFDDALISAGRTLPVDLQLHLGSAEGLRPDATAVVQGSLSETVAHADFDGDGLQDVMVGSYHENDFSGQVNVYAGTAEGMSAEPTLVIDAPDPDDSIFGSDLAIVGDLDGDGFVDAAISSAQAVYLYYADASGLPSTPSATLRNPGDGHRDAFGHALSGGDYDGDGFSDLAVGAPGAPSSFNADGPGRVYIFKGGPDGVASTPALTIESPVDSYWSNSSAYWPAFGRALR